MLRHDVPAKSRRTRIQVHHLPGRPCARHAPAAGRRAQGPARACRRCSHSPHAWVAAVGGRAMPAAPPRAVQRHSGTPPCCPGGSTPAIHAERRPQESRAPASTPGWAPAQDPLGRLLPSSARCAGRRVHGRPRRKAGASRSTAPGREHSAGAPSPQVAQPGRAPGQPPARRPPRLQPPRASVCSAWKFRPPRAQTPCRLLGYMPSPQPPGAQLTHRCHRSKWLLIQEAEALLTL